MQVHRERILVTICPLKKKRLQATVSWGSNTQALVGLNSGADESFIDAMLICQWGIPTTRAQTPLEAHALNGYKKAMVSHITSQSVSGSVVIMWSSYYMLLSHLRHPLS